MTAGGVPRELTAHRRCAFGGREGGVMVGKTEHAAGSRQPHGGGVGIGGSDRQLEDITGGDAGVHAGDDFRWLVVAGDDGDLHVAHYRANEHAVPPLLDEDGNVVFAHSQRRVPGEVASARVDVDEVAGRRESVAGNVLSLVATAGDETVAQTVAVGVVSTWVVVVRHARAAVVNGWVEQLRR